MPLSIGQLPDAALVQISSYLHKIDRALFAASLTAPSWSWEKHEFKLPPSETSKIIVSCTNWETINSRFDLSSQGAKLTDGDWGAMLVCIDAVNKLKKFTLLLQSEQFMGSGLKPLCGSMVLQQINFETYSYKCKISCASVVPILDSIISGGEESSLQHLQLPNCWRLGKSQLLRDFIGRYNYVMDERINLHCSQSCCLEICYSTIEDNVRSKNFGLQERTCIQCLDHFCFECKPVNVPFVCDDCEEVTCNICRPVRQCAGCNGNFCGDCKSNEQCDLCNGYFCNESTYEDECNTYGCDECKRRQCTNCGPLETRQCMECWKSICTDCVTEMNNVKHCTSCRYSLCMDCLSKKLRSGESVRNPHMKDGDDNCSFCRARVFPKLIEDIRLLSEKVEELEARILS